MKILVCVKQVADSESVIEIGPSGEWIAEEGLVFRMNRFDEYAVEESLVIRDAFPGSTVTAISAGPKRAEITARRAIEMGADRGVRVPLETPGYVSPMAVAFLIAAHARGERYDLILCGAMAEDDMQAQVGPLLAEMLDIPSATSAIAATVSGDASAIRVEREIEGGARELIDLSLPALVAVQPGINRPRYPSLSNVLRAKIHQIPTEEPVAAAHALTPERLVRLRLPERSGASEMLSGSPAEKAEKLLAILSTKSLLQGAS
jgi:electron transfer flavoprotein beta subunit